MLLEIEVFIPYLRNEKVRMEAKIKNSKSTVFIQKGTVCSISKLESHFHH